MMKRVRQVSWSVMTMLLFVSSGRPVTAEPAQPRDGQHDFDFGIGTWKSHVRRLPKPLTGSSDWVEGTGTVTTRKVWNGRADLEELTMETPAGRLEGLALRLYNPKTHQWRLHWANANKGAVAIPPSFGAFKDGRGEFYDQETFNGKTFS